MFRRILVPVDFSPGSEHALTYALNFAAEVGAEVEVMHVWQPSTYVAPTDLVYLHGRQESFWDHMKDDLARRVDAMVSRCGENVEGVTVATTVLAGYTSGTILDTLQAGAHDLVVMGTHGRSWLAHVLLGSVAARVVRLAPCPVITLRAPAPTSPTVAATPSHGLDTPTHI